MAAHKYLLNQMGMRSQIATNSMPSEQRPNPSIERTATGGARPGASAAIAAQVPAAHVKR